MIDKKMLEANLITLLGLETLPMEKKVAMLNKTLELVQKRLMISMLNVLDDANKAKFLELINAEGNEAEKDSFMKQHFPNLEQMVNEEIVKIKSELKEVAEI